jgi:hypothetical protein
MPLVPILSQMNPVHVRTLYFLRFVLIISLHTLIYFKFKVIIHKKTGQVKLYPTISTILPFVHPVKQKNPYLRLEDKRKVLLHPVVGL